MSEHQAITGYELVRNVFRVYSDDPVRKLIDDVAKGETEYLEFKATCVFDKDAPGNKEGETQQDLSWNIARELFALYNTKGGALIIGIDDKTFNSVPLPGFGAKSHNDYLRTMIRDKIFPADFEWSTKRGSEVYKCDERQVSDFIRKSLHIEYANYKGSTVAVLFVEPAPCIDDACIQIDWTKNQDAPYNQLLVRQPGNTGGVEIKTLYKDKVAYQETRRCTDTEYGRIWALHAPSPEFKTIRTKTKAHQPASAFDSTDPENDRLIRALDGRELEFEFPPGSIVDRYRIIRKIGQGGMGIVYEVEHLDLKEHRALKVFASDTPSDLLKRKFLSEARLLARFKHPGLVKAHALGVAEKSATLFYEMDLVTASSGRPMSLGEVYHSLNTSRAPSNTKLREWFAQLCNVLQYLHKRESIVHRDIKLENVLLNSTDMAVLSDFGIARIKDDKLRDELHDHMTMHVAKGDNGNANIGTPEYLAPELDKEKASAKSDNYALGVLFFKLLTGTGYTHQSGGDLQKALKGKPRFWRKVLPKLLAHDPKDRIEDLSKYAIKKTYPGMGLPYFLNKVLFAYIILSAIFIWASIRFGVWDSPSKIAADIRNTITGMDVAPSSVHNEAAALTGICQTPSRTKPTGASIPTVKNARIAKVDLRTSERDLRALNNYHLIESSHATLSKEVDVYHISPSIERIHQQIYSIWKETKELTNLGMQINEVITSRRDLVEKCAKIRQDAALQLQQIIATAEYKKALSFYTALNNEFRYCGMTEIPRPSFTPPAD